MRRDSTSAYQAHVHASPRRRHRSGPVSKDGDCAAAHEIEAATTSGSARWPRPCPRDQILPVVNSLAASISPRAWIITAESVLDGRLECCFIGVVNDPA